MSGKTAFIVGPGLIGWNVLDLLVAEGYQVTGLVRRKQHAESIERAGAKAVIGDLHDKSLITEETAKVDIVIHTATADDLPSVEAVLAGIAQRASADKPTIYIHTSGTGVLDDGAAGAHASPTIYTDADPSPIDALPDDAPHRPIDLAIVNASKQLGSGAKLAIMIPPQIYGYNPSHNRLSIQVPTLARFALKHGFAGHVGKGLSIESSIHVRDLARAYVVLLHALEARPADWVRANPYFFCENGREFTWKEVAEEVGQSLHAAGRISDPTPREFVAEEHYGELFGDITPAVIGLNSRSRAVRLRELGWEAREKGIWESWREDELPALLREWDERTEVEGRGECRYGPRVG